MAKKDFRNGLQSRLNDLEVKVEDLTDGSITTSSLLLESLTVEDGAAGAGDILAEVADAVFKKGGTVEATSFVGALTGNADTATTALNADHADDATHADDADHATAADSATNATNADEATHATSADSATSATNADHATTADSAGTADLADRIDKVTAPVNAAAATASIAYIDGTNMEDEAAATATVAYQNAVNVTGDKVITVNGKAYTFKAVLTPTEGEVLIGADSDASMTNLKNAIMHTGTPGTDYECAAAHPDVSAAIDTGTDTLTLTALVEGAAGNAMTLTTDEATFTLTDFATSATGQDASEVEINGKTYTFRTVLTPVEGEVLIGPNADASMTNLKNAINHTGTPSTDYECAAQHPDVAAGIDTGGDEVTLLARVKGAAGNAFTLTTNDASLTLDDFATTPTGVDGTVGAQGDIVFDADAIYVCTAANTITGQNWKRALLVALA
jgi:hypothetical protein